MGTGDYKLWENIVGERDAGSGIFLQRQGICGLSSRIFQKIHFQLPMKVKINHISLIISVIQYSITRTATSRMRGCFCGVKAKPLNLIFQLSTENGNATMKMEDLLEQKFSSDHMNGQNSTGHRSVCRYSYIQ